MKYLRKFNEGLRFDNRDYTNYHPLGMEWVEYNRPDVYLEIDNEFNIKYDELGYILVDLVERFNLSYRCNIKTENNKNLIQIELFPDVDLDKLYDDDFSFTKWLYNRMPDGKEAEDYMPFLEEIDSRLSDFGLTIKDLLPKDYRKDNIDFPFDFFAGKKYIQLWIGKI